MKDGGGDEEKLSWVECLGEMTEEHDTSLFVVGESDDRVDA